MTRSSLLFEKPELTRQYPPAVFTLAKRYRSYSCSRYRVGHIAAERGDLHYCSVAHYYRATADDFVLAYSYTAAEAAVCALVHAERAASERAIAADTSAPQTCQGSIALTISHAVGDVVLALYETLLACRYY